MNRATQDLQRITYTLSGGEVCEAIRQYLSDEHAVVLPEGAVFSINQERAQIVVEYPKSEEPKP
jgi:hypothetical protein